MSGAIATRLEHRNSWVGDEDDLVEGTLSASLVGATRVDFKATAADGSGATVEAEGFVSSEFVAGVVLGASSGELVAANAGSYRVQWIVWWDKGPVTFPEFDTDRDYWTLSEHTKP